MARTEPGKVRRKPVASIVIPAYNEERGIDRLLNGLLADTEQGEFEILVLCNGCTDGTVRAARRFEPNVTVVDLPEPSKRAALKFGDMIASTFPRLYIDSDVEIGAGDVRALAEALTGSTLVTAPRRVIPRDRVGMWVRAYYDVWERLPQVKSAPFGRGVIAVSDLGHERIRALPPVMADDLAMTGAFSSTERAIVKDANVIVWPPRTLRDLIRRRIRVQTGNTQIDQVAGRSPEIKTSTSDLVRLLRSSPSLFPRLAVFVAVSVVSRFSARRRARTGDFVTWNRDESSRLS